MYANTRRVSKTKGTFWRLKALKVLAHAFLCRCALENKEFLDKIDEAIQEEDRRTRGLVILDSQPNPNPCLLKDVARPKEHALIAGGGGQTEDQQEVSKKNPHIYASYIAGV